MRADRKLRVVLCWHMHQPDYRDTGGEFQLPWTYLHAIKDYVDMVAHLEAFPEARAVVNFAPLLLEQIDDYAQQVREFLDEGRPPRDALLGSLVDVAMPSDDWKQIGLIRACLRLHRDRMVAPYPAYQRLVEYADWLQNNSDALRYFHSQYLADLVVWYHLAWIGESVKRTDTRVSRLLEKGSNFDLEDRVELMQVVGDLLNGVLPRYRALADRGQIELSVTPYAHPIIPLLLDMGSAREALPDVEMPLLEAYPGGEQRARWHIEKGIETFRRHFGRPPAGCWPAEGSISLPTLRLLADAGFHWAASGGTVLRNSLQASQQPTSLNRAYRPKNANIACFFRDDGLSDLIGFTYADWHADDAVADLIHHLENIAGASMDGSQDVVSIIMDGENAWEYYPSNGYYFVRRLYEWLSRHPRIELTTFSDCLTSDVTVEPLERIVAGSWVYGTFSTWIGDSGKNRAWEMLEDVKRHYDEVVKRGYFDQSHRERIDRQLAVCEGSDWFWWFGDYNPADTVSDFEHLYRMNLASLYRLLGVRAPSYLSESFTHGAGSPVKGGTMRVSTQE